jgi:hypothetical protein
VLNNLLDEFMKANRSLYVNSFEARKEYNKYLYHFGLYEQYKNEGREMDNETYSDICSRDPSVLLECPIIYASPIDTEAEINKKISEAMNYDLVILRGFLPKFAINNSLFSLDHLERSYQNSKNKIDVIDQDPDFFGFTKNKHSRRSVSLNEYLKYVRSHILPPGQQQNNANRKDRKKVSYGVNIELTEYPDLYLELEKKLSPLLLFGSSYDLLSYVRRHIKGMTIPQMYIKVPNVWTGGHEENLRMRSINICHGPGSSFWWATPNEDSPLLVQKVEELYGTNIYKKEGIWFPPTEFFMKNKIKVFYTLQNDSDIVLVGPGTLHW